LAAAAAVLTKPIFRLGDRLRIQQERCRNHDYIPVGRLTTVVFEGQRNIRGLSQAQPRWNNRNQQKEILRDAPHMAPFSEKQNVLWSSLTLDWLTHKNAPILAVSRDRKDLLLPHGLTPLPDIPDPRWTPKTATDVVRRIPQLLTGCKVVGDRVRDKITDRAGRVFGILHPIIELCIVLAGQSGRGGFGRIRGGVDPADGTHLALLIDDSNPHQLQAYFVGGQFRFGE
jgi:hypothetical protein